MKKEITDNKHCPHCARHCELSSPRCGKGKVLAKKMQKEKLRKISEMEPVIKVKQEENMIQQDQRISFLFEKCANLFSEQEIFKKIRSKKKFKVIMTLARKGELSQVELQMQTGLGQEEIEKALHKLQKKGYIIRSQENQITLSEESKKAWNSRLKAQKQRGGLLAGLDMEEKKNLELILSKIYKNRQKQEEGER